MLFKPRKSRGITLTEFLITFSLGVFLIGTVLAIYYFTYRTWTAERTLSKLRINLEIAMENLKEEMRLSSATYTSGYPVNAAEFTAISFPAASRDANGFYALSGQFIDWDRSIIYHLYNNPATGNRELRKTVFTNNNAFLTNAVQRQAQLVSVAQNGDASGAVNRVNATTSVLIPRSPSESALMNVDFKITPTDQGFDGYAEDTQRTNVSFGSINLAPGAHTLKFRVIGKNNQSGGYALGIDTLAITPAGCAREPEVYITYAGLVDTISGSSWDTISKLGPDDSWSGKNYLEYDADAVGDYITFSFYYDLCRDSNFDDSQRENIVLSGDDLYAELPGPDESNETAWQAQDETGQGRADYNDAGGLPVPFADRCVRSLLNTDNILSEGGMVRVKFTSHSSEALTITAAYLDVKDPAGGATPSLKYDPSVPGEAQSYENTHVQLFFTNPDTGVIEESVTIDPGHATSPRMEAYSNWAIYPFAASESYFITFHTSSGAGSANVSYWPGQPGEINSYLITGSAYLLAVDWPDSGETVYSVSPDIYVTALTETWQAEGTVTTRIFDTKRASPVYGGLDWSEYEPSNTNVSVRARTSDDENMADDPAWGSIESERYVQFRANLSVIPTWRSRTMPSVEVSDDLYKHDGQTHDSTGEPLIPTICIGAGHMPWIDNITIDWPGEDTVCEISGYFIQNPDYGIISLLVDGQPLAKTWDFEINVKQDVKGKTYEAVVVTSTEPRNTGK